MISQNPVQALLGTVDSEDPVDPEGPQDSADLGDSGDPEDPVELGFGKLRNLHIRNHRNRLCRFHYRLFGCRRFRVRSPSIGHN